MVNFKAFELVSDLQKEGLDILLTGGAPIEIWSGEAFKTSDWDIVAGLESDYEKITETLRKFGYEKRGNSWYLVREGLPPRNPGELIKSKYPWAKTHTLKIGNLFEVETVAPEWLFVNRAKKARAGEPKYAEQALFIHDKFSDSDWNEELVRDISNRRGVPKKGLELDYLENIASS